MNQQWLQTFRRETSRIIDEPWLRCLAEAVAAVESDWGRRALTAPDGLNEIGYKAVRGKPSILASTREADALGNLNPTRTAFRLFADRTEQAQALAWLMRSSVYYEAARLLFALAFYSAYAPGRREGARALVDVFNQIAATGAHAGVRPFSLVESGGRPYVKALNHHAARDAVRLFAELTSGL